MDKKELYHSYVNSKGKRVTGTASFLHHVFNELGGIQEYNDSVGAEYIREFINEHSDTIQEAIVKKARKKRFKVV